MKKTVLLSAIASTLVMAGGDIAPVEPIVAAPEVKVDYGTVFGQARAFYVDRTYSGLVNNNRNGLAVGGYAGYTTPVYEGLKFTVAAYGTYGFNIHDIDLQDDTTYTKYSPALNGRDGDNYAFIGQAYLDYTRGNTNLKIGRQKLDTPMAGSDDARMLPNLFEAAVVSNTDIENTTLIAAHVTRMTMGTFSNIYDNSATLGLYSGYGLGTTLAQSGDFEDMGVVALGAGTDTSGVTAGAIMYNGIENLKLQAWDYYAHDIANIVYLQADYGWNCLINNDIKMVGSLQYINESDAGDALAAAALTKELDGNYWGAQLSATYGNFNAKAAYSQTGNGTGILSPWGGMPAFTQGMVTRHQFFPDTNAWKVSGTYNFADLNLNATVYYASYDIGTGTGYISNDTSTEAGFDLIYQATSDLQLRFRGNFPRDFKTGLDWDEYRVIANYNF